MRLCGGVGKVSPEAVALDGGGVVRGRADQGGRAVADLLDGGLGGGGRGRGSDEEGGDGGEDLKG